MMDTLIPKLNNNTYDSLTKANAYNECFKDNFWKDVDDYTLQQLVGDVTNKSILEIGCGEGRVCRNIVMMGPLKKLVGTDIAAPMIERAKEISDNRIEFYVTDPTKPVIMDGGKQFDLAVSVYVLQYASNYEELKTIINSAYINLKEGGRFVGIFSAFNPSMPLRGYNRLFATYYEWAAGTHAPFGEINAVMSSAVDDSVNFPMLVHAIYPEMFERAVKEVGFVEIRRKRYQVAPEARDSYDEDEVNKELSHIYVFELIK